MTGIPERLLVVPSNKTLQAIGDVSVASSSAHAKKIVVASKLARFGVFEMKPAEDPTAVLCETRTFGREMGFISGMSSWPRAMTENRVSYRSSLKGLGVISVPNPVKTSGGPAGMASY